MQKGAAAEFLLPGLRVGEDVGDQRTHFRVVNAPGGRDMSLKIEAVSQGAVYTMASEGGVSLHQFVERDLTVA